MVVVGQGMTSAKAPRAEAAASLGVAPPAENRCSVYEIAGVGRRRDRGGQGERDSGTPRAD
jgi:hypothetical protein